MVEAFDKANEPAVTNETEWIIDGIEFTKKCRECGAVMRGWAYRQPFNYCPICGRKAQ